MLWSEKFANAVFSDQSNLEGKIPLQLAVEKRHVKWEYANIFKVGMIIAAFIAVLLLNLRTSILKTLKTCVDGEREAKQRETKPPLWLRRLKTEFGNKMIPYLLHASSCGSLSVIKYLLAIWLTPNIRYIYIYWLLLIINAWTIIMQYMLLGASLSKPHSSVTALHTCDTYIFTCWFAWTSQL